jgi:AraC-like DNA-binding protein
MIFLSDRQNRIIGGGIRPMHFLKTKIEKPVTFISCGHFSIEEEWIHSKRVIDSFEIIIGVRGAAYIQQEDERYELTPGKVLLLAPGREHRGFRFSKGETSFYWLHFKCSSEFNILNEREAGEHITPVKTNPYFSKLNDSVLFPYFSSPSDIEKISILFRQLLHMTNTSYYTSFGADYVTTLLLVELTQEFLTDRMKNEDSYIKDSKFSSILEWIRINLDKGITVNEIAEKFNYNRDYVSRIFKKNLGVSTKKYINGLKILKAKELLFQTNLTIKEVAYKVGFHDERYFMKLFKEYENITPTEYRNIYYNTHYNNK